jgi:antitoxin component of MazEF toxin-antitoxin module
MKIAVQKCGHDFTVVNPPNIAAQSHLEAGTLLDLSVQEGRLVLKPVTKPTLEELVSCISPENCHDETILGAPVGREVW